MVERSFKVGALDAQNLYLRSNGYLTALLANPVLNANLTFSLPSTIGSTGQVLTSDGSGNLFFSDVSVLGSNSNLTSDQYTITSINSFSLSQSVKNANNILVTLDGIVQSPNDDYVVVGSTLYFNNTEPLASGVEIEVRYLNTTLSDIGGGGGDSSNVWVNANDYATYTVLQANDYATYTVLQANDYATYTTLTSLIDNVQSNLTSISGADISSDQTTIYSANTFALSYAVSDANNIIVSLDGIVQSPNDDYIVSGNVLTLNNTIPIYDGVELEVRYLSMITNNIELGAIAEDIIPDSDSTRDLGSASRRWKDLYLSGNSIILGDTVISSTNGAIAFTSEANTASLATQDYVDAKVAALVDSAPEALNTLNELSSALGNNANFASSVTTLLAAKANTASLAAVATTGSYNSLSNRPSLATVATTGSYNDLLNKPTTSELETVTILASPTVSLDLTKTKFRLPMSLDTTITTSNNPAADRFYEGKLLLIGNAVTNSFNITSNPGSAITNWRAVTSYTNANFRSTGSQYGFFCVSPDGTKVAAGEYVGTSDYRFSIATLSTPFDVSTATVTYQSGSVHNSLAGQANNNSLGIRGGAFFKDNNTIHVGTKYINATTGAITSSTTGSLPDVSENNNTQGNWTSNGLKFYTVKHNQNASPIIYHYETATPFSASGLSLIRTTTLTRDFSFNNPTTRDGSKAVWVSDNGTAMYYGGTYIANDYSSMMILKYTLSTPFNVSTASYANENYTTTGTSIWFGKFVDNGGAFFTPISTGFRKIGNLSTPAIPNTITWPENWYWAGGTTPAAPSDDQSELITFITTDGGSTFLASSTKY